MTNASRIIVDVGAGIGEFAIEAAKLNARAKVIAFEPNPDLASVVQKTADVEKLNNLEVSEIAIANRSGDYTLNVSRLGDQGVSSFLQFDSTNIRQDAYWSERSDLVFEEAIPVRCEPLSDFLISRGIRNIDFLKVDAQGFDLDVIESCKEINVRSGMLEATSTLKRRLYKREVDLRVLLNRLDELGYEVWDIKPNDPSSAEFNVFFTSKGESLRQMERELSLLEIPIYSGKHFWHSPSRFLQVDKADGPALVPRSELLKSQRRESDLRELALEVEKENLALENELELLKPAYEELQAVTASKSWRWTRIARIIFSPFTTMGRGDDH